MFSVSPTTQVVIRSANLQFSSESVDISELCDQINRKLGANPWARSDRRSGNRHRPHGWGPRSRWLEKQTPILPPGRRSGMRGGVSGVAAALYWRQAVIQRISLATSQPHCCTEWFSLCLAFVCVHQATAHIKERRWPGGWVTANIQSPRRSSCRQGCFQEGSGFQFRHTHLWQKRWRNWYTHAHTHTHTQLPELAFFCPEWKHAATRWSRLTYQHTHKPKHTSNSVWQ